MPAWPRSEAELLDEQAALAAARPPAWSPSDTRFASAGCFVCFPRGKAGAGDAGDPAWAAAALSAAGRVLGSSLVEGEAGFPYRPGLLALREGPLLEAAVRGLGAAPDVVVVDATGRDHPRRAGLALHLGAVLELPSVGVTHRPLLAEGEWPPDEPGATSPLVLGGETVGHWLRTRRGARPLAVHAGWRTDPETAVAVVLASTRATRTPQPLREARRIARRARAASPAGFAGRHRG